MTIRLIWEDLAIEVPDDIAAQAPEAVLAYEEAALEKACRVAHGKSLAAYRAALARQQTPTAEKGGDT